DMNMGRFAPVGFALAGVMGITTAAQGTLLGIDYDSGALYQVSDTDATYTLIGHTGIALPAGLEYGPGGVLYAYSAGATSELFSIDPSTGAATTIGSLGSFAFEGGLAFSPGGTAYGVALAGAASPEL